MAKAGRHKIDEPREKMIGARVTVKEYEELKKRAAEHNLTLSQAVTESIKLLYKKWGY